MSESKTMNVSEAMAKFIDFGVGDWRSILEGMVGTTIIADPEPRPDFASMAPSDLLSWIYQNASHDDTHRLFDYLTNVANRAANQKGLT